MFVGVLGLVALLYLGDLTPKMTPPTRSSPPGGLAEKTYLGHYGYVVQVPEGYVVASDFKDTRRTHEVVHLFPKGTDRAHLANEGLYGPLGILRLEVQPRRIPEGRIGIEAVRAGVTATLQARRAVFATRDLQVGAMPAFLVTVTAPSQLAQAFVVGSRVLYVLTGGSESPAFTEVLQNLHEAAPRERPSASR